MSFVGHTGTGSNYKNLFAEPPTNDSVDNRGRNVIARGLCRLKQWPGLATRYEKLVTVYRVGAVLNEVIARTRRLAGTPTQQPGLHLPAAGGSCGVSAHPSVCDVLERSLGDRSDCALTGGG